MLNNLIVKCIENLYVEYLNKPIAVENLDNYSLVCYRLRHLTQTQKVRFFYALKGRGSNPGIIKQYKIKQLAKGVLMVSQETLEQTIAFLNFWKCIFSTKEVTVDKRTKTGTSAATQAVESSIITYSLKHLTQTDKVKFFYALKGRGNSTGIVKRYKIEQLAKGCLIANDENVKRTLEFLRYWKCPVTQQKILIDERPQKKSR